MSDLFGNINVSGSGVSAAQTWLNTIAGNIANMDDVSPTDEATYGEQTPVFEPDAALGQVGEGVTVAGVDEGSTAGIIEADPTSPLADAQGEVRVPDIELGGQMVNMIQAQDDYQANTSAMADARSAYQSALTLGT
ncbi:MAG TPA: flagellar basal body rod C-terminal domain-containing protein [Acidimicrobiales bacterium]|nr:flagellar basal body rod C-terminal domain-containing protein [Acidimicrobiales bacterium]